MRKCKEWPAHEFFVLGGLKIGIQTCPSYNIKVNNLRNLLVTSDVMVILSWIIVLEPYEILYVCQW